MRNVDTPIIYQSNKLTEAKYEFSLLEKKAFLLIIKKVRENYINTDRGQRDLFNDLVIKFKPSDIELEQGKASDVYNAMRLLRKREFFIDNEDISLSTGLINYAEHRKKEGFFEISVGKKIFPFVLDIATQYTSFSFMVAMSFRSIYSVRFYEWLCEWKSKGGFNLSINEIKNRLMIAEKYPLYGGLKRDVINVAYTEIKELFDKGECDLYFEYTEYKEGRSVAGLRIKIITAPIAAPKQVVNDTPKIELLPAKEFNPLTAISDLYNDLLLMTENELLVKTKLTEIMNNRENLEDLYNQILGAKARYDLGAIKNIKAYTEAILNKF